MKVWRHSKNPPPWPCSVDDTFTLKNGRTVEIKFVCRPSGGNRPGWFGVWFCDSGKDVDHEKWEYQLWEKFKQEVTQSETEVQG